MYINREKILKPQINKMGKGYFTVGLCKRGKQKNELIHRLVAKAFIPNPKNLPMVNHKDGNTKNNKKNNLEWCTCQENIQHAYRTGLKKSSEKVRKHAKEMGKSMRKKVYQYDLNGRLLQEYESVSEVTKKTGINSTGIYLCCNNKKVEYKGFIWSYKQSK